MCCCVFDMRMPTSHAVNFMTLMIMAMLLNERLLKQKVQALAFSSSSLCITTSNNVAVVGGGLAGLATAYHLLEKKKSSELFSGDIHVTIFDKASVGTQGASSVAGG